MQAEFMRQAIALALENIRLNRGGPFAALVVKNGAVIAQGSNLVTSTNDPTAHAEVVAIRNACSALHSFQLDGCDVYATCEPCPMCLGALYWARPDHIYFGATALEAAEIGFDDRFIYEQIALPHAQRSIPMLSLRTADTLAPFLAWRYKPDKVEY